MTPALRIDELDRGLRLALAGRLDVHSAPQVRTALHRAVDDGDGDLVVQLGDLEIWDATGLGVLVGVHRRARRAGRRLVLADVPPRAARLLKATRLSRIFTLNPTVTSAG